MTSFLPDSYKDVPQAASNYMKLKEGVNKFRILSSAVVGWEYFSTDNKPIRQREKFDLIPDDIKINDDGTFSIKHFWAFAVWNYEEKRVQILELTQSTIQRGMKIKIDNRKGEAKSYDWIITRTGKGLSTEYDIDVSEASSVSPEIEAAYKAKPVNLQALFEGGDPFAKSPDATVAKVGDSIDF